MYGKYLILRDPLYLDETPVKFLDSLSKIGIGNWIKLLGCPFFGQLRAIDGSFPRWGETSPSSNVVRKKYPNHLHASQRTDGVKSHCIEPRGSAGRFTPPPDTLCTHR